MSLSFFFRLMVFLVAAAGIAQLSQTYSPDLFRQFLAARVSTAQPITFDRRALVYRVAKDRPLSFTFSRPAPLIRMMTQPAVRADLRGQKAGFIYQMHIRLLDNQGSLISEHRKYIHAQSPDDVFASGDVWRFFRDRPELIGAQDEVFIETDPGAARVEIAVLGADPGVEGVDVRVQEQRPLLDSQTLSAFRRRSSAEQRQLADANAFPPDMLTGAEIDNLIRNLWRPVGPDGIEGRDYLSLVLYEAERLPDVEAAP
jgi:hypothetical protein